MSEKTFDFAISADPGAFVSGMQTAAEAAKGSAEKIKSNFDTVGKAFEEVQKKLLIITSIVAGGAFFKEAIAETNKLTGETMKLAKRLGITGEEASALNTALGDIYSDTDTYIGAFDKFAKQIKTNESGLKEMGLQTRDSNGHLRDSQTLFQEALNTVGQYKPGLDQTTAAMQLFGKGVDDAMKLQKLNNGVIEEARKKNEALGLTLSQEGVQATKEYKAAMNDVGDVMLAVKNTIGKAVMPVFTEMGNYFASTGPYVIDIFKGALTGLMLVFRGVQVVVTSVFAVIFEVINTTIDQIGNLGELVSKVFSGDFSGAGDVWERMKQRTAQGIRSVVGAAGDALTEAQDKFKTDFERVWSKGTAMAAPKGGTRTQGEFKTEGAGADTKDKSMMKVYEAELVEAKRVATEKDALHGLSKEAELKYWQNILATATLSEEDKVAVGKKAGEARIELLKQEAQQANQVGTLALAAWQARELAKVDSAAADAQLQVQLGQSTQEQLLQQQAEFEDRRAAIKRTAIEANLAALDPDRDPVEVAQLNNQLEALETEHQAKLQIIRGQAAVQQNKVWEDLQGRMVGLYDKGLQAMLNGSLTFKGALQAVFTELASWFAKAVVGDMLKKWLAGKAAQLQATIFGVTAEKVAQATGSAATVGIKATEATAVIGANAAEAASGAAASQASVPVIGPGLAIAAFAAIFAMVLGAKSMIPSARSGFDIPAGVNPLTQLHEREMVLPAAQADVIRGLEGQGAGGGSVQVNLQAHAMPGNYFMVHQDHLVAAINAAVRNGALKRV